MTMEGKNIDQVRIIYVCMIYIYIYRYKFMMLFEEAAGHREKKIVL